MLFWLAQEELSEGVRKVEGVSRKEMPGKPEWLSNSCPPLLRSGRSFCLGYGL